MKIRLALFVLASVFINSADAHHSFAAAFAGDEIITVEGRITRFIFKNPHIAIYIDVESEDGRTTEWLVEGAAATGYRLAGWNNTTIQKGWRVSVTGQAGRFNRPIIALQKGLTRLDPKTGAEIEFIGAARKEILPPAADSPDRNLPQALDNGLPNLTGIWVHAGDFKEPSFLLNDDPVFTPAGQALQDTIDAAYDPQYLNCEDAGLVRQVAFTPHPMSLTQYEDRVVFAYEEYAGKRTVYLDNRDYESFDTTSRSRMGRYKAYYQDEALIIESDLLESAWTGIFGQIYSDQATVVETYTRNDDEKWGPALHLSAVVTDPLHLAEPWELAWDKYYSVRGLTGNEPENDNIQRNYEMLPVECQIPLKTDRDG